MDTQVKCGFCDASNLASAFSCAECSMPLVDDLPASTGAPTQQPEATADPPPPPPPPAAFAPYTGPPKTKEAPAAEPDAEDVAEPPAPTLAPLPGYRIGGNVIAGTDAIGAAAPLRPLRDPNRVAWGWHHVVALGVLLWGIPFAIDWWLGIDRSLAALLNRAMAVQIAGYLLGALAVGALVRTRQQGDWSTLGLGDDARKGRMDLLRGVGFGLAMFLGYLPVGIFTNGRSSLDPVVALLLGNANGAGLVLTCAIVIVGAPVVEEIFFRGLLYEKIARHAPQVAIGVTSVLFMLIHGAIVLQILVLGLVFAFKRWKGESVWFTIGAHAAWNASVVLAGLIMLTGSAIAFTSSVGTYELHYARDWERHEEMEMSILTGRIDLALTSPNGSAMAAMEFSGVPTLGRVGSAQLLEQMPMAGAVGNNAISNFDMQPTSFAGAAEAYDITASITVEGMSLDYEMKAMRPYDSDKLVLFMLACPRVSCDAASPDFHDLLESVKLI